MIDTERKVDIEKRSAAQLVMEKFLGDEIPFTEEIESFVITVIMGGDRTTVVVDNKIETVGASKAILALAEYLETFKEEIAEGEVFAILQSLSFGDLLEKSFDERYQYRPTLAALTLKRVEMIIPELKTVSGCKIEIEIICKE